MRSTDREILPLDNHAKVESSVSHRRKEGLGEESAGRSILLVDPTRLLLLV